MSHSPYLDIPLDYADPLGRSIYARSIVRYLLDTAAPGIIGIVGPRGCGKTTLLRLLRLHTDEDFFLEHQDEVDNPLGESIETFWKKTTAVRTFFTIRIDASSLYGAEKIGESVILRIVTELVTRIGSRNSRLLRRNGEYQTLVSRASKFLRIARNMSDDTLSTTLDHARGGTLLATLMDSWNSRHDTARELASFIDSVLAGHPDAHILVCIDHAIQLSHEERTVLLEYLHMHVTVARITFIIEMPDDTDAMLSVRFALSAPSVREISILLDTYPSLRPIFARELLREELARILRETTAGNLHTIKTILNEYFLWDAYFAENPENLLDAWAAEGRIVLIESIALRYGSPQTYNALLSFLQAPVSPDERDRECLDIFYTSYLNDAGRAYWEIFLTSRLGRALYENHPLLREVVLHDGSFHV